MNKQTEQKVRKIIQEEIESAMNEFGDQSPHDMAGNRSGNYLFTVDNDQEGIEKIKAVKDSFEGIFKLRLRGRHHDRKEVLGSKWQAGTQNDIPWKQAEKIAVYVVPAKAQI